jgi:glutamate racemase
LCSFGFQGELNNGLQMIGIFDSGFGGLTVMRHIQALLPFEEILYFGDTARLPYGDKSPKTITEYCLERSRFLVEKGIDILVIACHSACSVALSCLRAHFSIPIIGITEYGLNEIPQEAKTVVILGTRATITAGLYEKRIHARFPNAEILGLACPLFVPLVEEGYYDHLIASLVVKEYLQPLQNKRIDAVILGCTHYPLLQKMLQQELKDIPLIDPGAECALALLNVYRPAGVKEAPPRHTFYVSDHPEKFRSLGEVFLKGPIETIVNVHS